LKEGEEVTFFEKKVTKKTFAWGRGASTQKFFAELFFKKATSSSRNDSLRFFAKNRRHVVSVPPLFTVKYHAVKVVCAVYKPHMNGVMIVKNRISRVRAVVGLVGLLALGGCIVTPSGYAYNAGYAYGGYPYGAYAYPDVGYYGGHPYYGGYAGSVFIGPGFYGGYAPGYFGRGWLPGYYAHGFYGHPGPGFGGPGFRGPGGFGRGGAPGGGMPAGSGGFHGGSVAPGGGFGGGSGRGGGGGAPVGSGSR